MYLIHWPVAVHPKGDELFPKRADGTRDINLDWDLRDTWKQMEALVKKGKVKSIGVSNCSIPKLEYILETAEIVPAVNQVNESLPAFRLALSVCNLIARLDRLNFICTIRSMSFWST